MKHLSSPRAASLALTLLVLGCPGGGEGPGATKPGSTTPAGSPEAAAPVTDTWLGQWNGPEGTFLRLAGGQGHYEITIQDLDGPKVYAGTAADGRIWFERDGVKESIRATTGAETGMKWLAEKTNCLTVRPGEGYCRG